MSAFARFSGTAPKSLGLSWWGKASFALIPITAIPIHMANTHWIDKYQDLMSYYRNGKPVPVPENLRKTFSEVKKEMPMLEFSKKFISLFMVSGFDTFHAGSTRTLTGGVVGIPRFFTYESVEEANKGAKEIRIQDSPVPWDYVDPDIRNKFFNSLYLSEKAKKYAMAYNCFLVDTANYAVGTLLALALPSLNAMMGEHTFKKLDLKKSPRIVRVGVGIFLIVGMVSSWISLDHIQVTAFEDSANKKILSMGKEYLEGGLEYWSKRVDRNIALRVLMNDGESRYSVNGKELAFLFGYRGITPVDQKHFYAEKLEELRKSQEADAIEAGKRVDSEKKEPVKE